MIDIDKKLNDLEKSKFRSGFHLSKNMKEYCKKNGYLKIKEQRCYC